MPGEPTKLRYSVRAWVAIIAVVSGPMTILLLVFHAVPRENGQTVGLVVGLVLGWGTLVVSSQFGRLGPAPAKGDDPA